jgi:threonine/homoserine/homoserine lactone efflux protein
MGFAVGRHGARHGIPGACVECGVVTNALLGFAIVAGLMTLVPGIDTALVLRAGVTQGTRAAYATVAGISLGLVVWAVAAAAGVSALLTGSRTAYEILQLAGAGYLVWLGGRLLWQTRTGGLANPEALEAAKCGTRRAFTRGLVTNLLNPKIGVFYVAVLPQFLPPDTASLLAGIALAMVHVLEGVVWFSVLILGTAVLRQRLAQPRVRTWTDRVTGLVLVGFGVKVALSRT